MELESNSCTPSASSMEVNQVENSATVAAAPGVETQSDDVVIVEDKTKDSNTQKKRKVGQATTNEADAGDSSKIKPCKPKSFAWEHFKKHDKTSRAQCNWCGATYAADSHKNDTSNLRNHLLKQCRKFPKHTLDPTQGTLTLQDMKKEDGKGIGSSLCGVHFDVDVCRKALARIIKNRTSRSNPNRSQSDRIGSDFFS